MAQEADVAVLARELRVTIGQFVRRLRAEHGFPLGQGTALGLLDRGGPRSIGELATANRVRPQSMAETVRELEAAGLVSRHADPADGRRAIIDLTDAGRVALTADRLHRDGWLAGILAEQLSEHERSVLQEAARVLSRIAES